MREEVPRVDDCLREAAPVREPEPLRDEDAVRWDDREPVPIYVTLFVRVPEPPRDVRELAPRDAADVPFDIGRTLA